VDSVAGIRRIRRRSSRIETLEKKKHLTQLREDHRNHRNDSLRIYLTRQLLTCSLCSMKSQRTAVAEHAEHKPMMNSRHQEVVVLILRAHTYLRESGSKEFEERGITPQQYNVLRILKGAGPAGLPTLDIVQRMVERTPGITRLLDRLETKKLVRRERPSDDRRQVLCYVTKSGIDLVNEIDTPLKNVARQLLERLSDSELEELAGLLGKLIGKK
jgi:DNA-binding MarR family transcriptional regulator